MERNPSERLVHLTGAKAEGFCRELRNEPDLHPAETSYPHLVTCRACIDFLKQQLGTGNRSQNTPK